MQIGSGRHANQDDSRLRALGEKRCGDAGVCPQARGHKSAHVIGLHLTPDLPVYGEFPAEVSQEVIDRLQKAGDDAAAAAKAPSRRLSRAAAVTHEWRGFVASYVVGRRSDRAAGPQRGPDRLRQAKRRCPDAWSDFAEIALMRSGRPVLLVPPEGAGRAIGTRAVIAWNDTREAARRFRLARSDRGRGIGARRSPALTTRSRRAAAEANGAPLDRHARPARHQAQRSRSRTPPAAQTGAAIRAKLLDAGCDLLIMGGYSHSRFREMLFGGVSRDILRNTLCQRLCRINLFSGGSFSMTLKKIRLELARDREHPEGSSRHGYEFVGPLDKEGHLDP